MSEIWKPVKGFPNYQISSIGRVKSIERIEITTGCVKKRLRKEVMLQPALDRGYHIVSISKRKKQHMKKVHRLVAVAFIPNPLNKRTINHKNGIKNDNRVDNLEWATDLENNQHARRNGYCHDEKAINQIKDGVIIATFKSMMEAHRQTKVQVSNISYCCSGARPSAGGYQWEYKNKEATI